MLKAIREFLYFLYDFLVPRLITEDVAVVRVGPGNSLKDYEPVCPMSLVDENDEFDGIITADSFTWLFIGITYRVSNFRPWSG